MMKSTPNTILNIQSFFHKRIFHETLHLKLNDLNKMEHEKFFQL